MPSCLTGFEAGMMGYAIYGAVYGLDNIWKFGIVALGQVLFVFFVLVPGLKRLSSGATSFRDTLVGFLKTPVIVAILAGLLFICAVNYGNHLLRAGYYSRSSDAEFLRRFVENPLRQ